MTLAAGRPRTEVVLAAVDDSVAAVAVARSAGETALTCGAQVVVLAAVEVPPEHPALAGPTGIDEPGPIAGDADATLGRARPMLDRLDVKYRTRVAAYVVRGGRWGRGRRIAYAVQRAADGEATAPIADGHALGRHPARWGLLRRGAPDVLAVPVTSMSPASDRTPPTLVPTTPRSIP